MEEDAAGDPYSGSVGNRAGGRSSPVMKIQEDSLKQMTLRIQASVIQKRENPSEEGIITVAIHYAIRDRGGKRHI